MSYVVLQNVPGLTLLTLCFMGIFALPHYAHRGITGEYKRVGRDNWDYALDQRDARLKKERVERLKREQLAENDFKKLQQ